MIYDFNVLKPYFDGQKKHPAYNKTVELYEAMRIHANGEKPAALLNDYRPSESKEIHDYRLKIYEPITEELISQITTSLSKIRRSSDWSIKYSDKLPANIAKEETPYAYFEENYPYFSSLTNWVFSVLLKKYLTDPNAVILVVPTNTETDNTEYLQPYPIIFNSDSVLEYEEGKWAILKSTEKCSYRAGNSMRHDGDVFYVVDSEHILRYERRSQGFALEMEYTHGLSKMPCFGVSGVFFDAFDKRVVKKSRIGTVVPRLNKVIRGDSDLDGTIVCHLYPESWEYATQPCDECYDATKGVCTGTVKRGSKVVKCSKCAGTLTIASSGPYKKMVVRPANIPMGEQAAPTPPKGYIDKPFEIVKLQSEIIEKNQYKALQSINMQYLLETPQNESGYAKEVDRDELNNFVHSIAEDLVRMMDLIYAISVDYRYMDVVPNEAARKELLPAVAVPEKYDILSLSYLLEEITTAIEKKINPVILQAMLVEFVNKKFYSQPELRDMLVCSLQLDPMPCATDDEKVLRKQNGGVTELDYITSCKLVNFIQRAVVDHKDFYAMPMKAQMAVVRGYAEEVQKENSGATAIFEAANAVA